MMGKDGQHVRDTTQQQPQQQPSTSAQPQPDEPHRLSTSSTTSAVSPHAELPTPAVASVPAASSYTHPSHLLRPLPEVSVVPPDQPHTPPWASAPSQTGSHMTGGHVTSPPVSLHSALLSTFPSAQRQRLIPPPPIPNIVIDARDAFGHSRTPPFVPSPSQWTGAGTSSTSGSTWGLMIPGLGKKPRAHSDSSILGLERELEAASPLMEPPASASALPGQQRPSEAGVFRFETAYIQQHTDPHHQPHHHNVHYHQHAAAAAAGERSRAASSSLTVPYQTAVPVERQRVSPTEPMETDRPASISPPQPVPADTTQLQPEDLSLAPPPHTSTAAVAAAAAASHKPSVPFLWHFSQVSGSKHGLEKSPKTYWLRRHSDSNVPATEGQVAAQSSSSLQAPASVRSLSTGDTIIEGETVTTTPGRGQSEGHTPLASPLLPSQQPATHVSDSPERSEQHEPSPGPSTGVRRDEGVVSKRLKLKKYLQKRYQLSLRSVRQRQSSDTDDVFSDRGPETPSPGFMAAATQSFTYRPRTPGSGSSRTESSSLDPDEEEEEDESTPPARPSPTIGTRPVMPIKTEPISPCGSEGDEQPETPVFASPLLPPGARAHSESPRWGSHHGNVFQFSPQGRGSPVFTPPGRGSPVYSPHSRGSPVREASPLREDTSMMASRAQAQEAALGRTSRASEHRLSRTQHVESLTSPPDLPSHQTIPQGIMYSQAPPAPTSQPLPPSSTQGPLPPFSTMLQRPPGHQYPHSPPGYGPPISPSATRPWAPGPSAPAPGPGPPSLPPHPQQFPPQLPSTSSTAPPLSQQQLPGPPPPSHSTKSDPSKIIYCPFSEKVQEQRHSRDPNTTFMCPVCGQVFPSYNYLANHMVNHLPSEVVTKGPGDSNKIHLCKVCNRAFSRSDMLTRHMRLHTGLRPYECRICGQVFSRSDHLHTHLRTHTGEKPYRCPQCPYAAPRRDMITRHMRIHMKQMSRRGRRSSSASSAEPSTSTATTDIGAPTGHGSPVQDVKRRNQSLSSVESQDSTESMFRRGSSASEVAEMDSPQAKSRSWSITSGESMEGPDYPQRHWSATSMESTESYPSPRGDPSPRRPYFSFHQQGSGDSSSGGSGEGAHSLQVPGHGAGSLWAMGASIEEGMEHSPSSSPSISQALSPGSDSLSAEMQTSFQKCKVTSDKDSSSGSDKDSSNVSSPMHKRSGPQQQVASPHHKVTGSHSSSSSSSHGGHTQQAASTGQADT